MKKLVVRKKTGMVSRYHDYEIGRIIVVADRGLNTSDNTSDEKNNDGYVYGQSIRGADAEFKKWVLEPDGYLTTMEKNRMGKRFHLNTNPDYTQKKSPKKT